MNQERCCVCGEPVDQTNSSICNGCGRPYHLNQRSDQPGKDCGEVWINDQYLALEFGCFLCLRGEAPAAAAQATAPAQRRRLRKRLPRPVRRRYRKQM